MNRYFIILLLLIFSMLSVNAQRRSINYNANTALPWVTGKLPINSDKVRYKVVYGEGITYQQAREEAFSALIIEIGWEHGITVSSNTIEEIKHTIDKENSGFSQSTSTTTIIKQDDFTTSITKVDEYSEIDRETSQLTLYKVWQLYVVDCEWANQIKLNYSRKYGFETAGWRSSIIPGWGQFYKKQYIKGSLFLGSEVACIATTMYFHNRYNRNVKKSFETHILDIQKEYSNRASKHKLYRNVSIGASFAIWIWNVLDASFTDGRPRYIDSKFDFSLNSTYNNELLFSLTYKF